MRAIGTLMGGHKCLQELVLINRSIKVIITSGYSMEWQIKESLDAGAKGYVGKALSVD